MATVGRPSSLTPETVASLVQSIQNGLTYTLASQLVGIDYVTFRSWMKAGEKATSGDKRDFYLAIKAAEAEGARKNLERIDKAASSDWRAAAWIMERRHAREYKQVSEVHDGRSIDWSRVPDTLLADYTDGRATLDDVRAFLDKAA